MDLSEILLAIPQNLYNNAHVIKNSGAGMTQKQKAIYDFIVNQLAKSGYPPSRGEIAEHFGVWPNTIQCQLRSLVRQGRLELVKGVSRGIRIIEAEKAEGTKNG